MSFFSKPQAEGASPFSNSNPFQASANQNNNNNNSPFSNLNTKPATSQPQASGSLFGGAAPQQATSSPFGGSAQQQPASSNTTSLFGGSTLLGSNSNQQNNTNNSNPFGGSGNLTGGSAQNTQQQPASQTTSSLFGNLGSNNNQQQNTSSSNLFGGSQQQSQQGDKNWWGHNANLTGRTAANLFGGSTQDAQQQQQGQPNTLLESRLLKQPDASTRPRTVTEQIDVAFSKWNPQSSNTVFQTYLYNSVPREQAPFFGPGPQDDEAKWEEALKQRPNPGAIPVMVRGFEQLAIRMGKQYQHLLILQGRLHEINDGLELLLRKHDIDISTRAVECKRKHLRLSQQCLRLAAKAQVLRNRGYALDSTEEELRKQLFALEKTVFDPVLNGRGEEIWARMVSVRERGRQLQREYERAGRNLADGAVQEIDGAVLKKASKILEDYHQQLSHLVKELTQIQKEFAEWEGGKSGAITNGSG